MKIINQYFWPADWKSSHSVLWPSISVINVTHFRWWGHIYYKLSLLCYKFQHSSFFIAWSLTSIHTLSLTLCRWYNQTVFPILSDWAAQKVCFFSDLNLLSGTHCLLISTKLTPQTLSKLTSKLTFSTLSILCAQAEWIKLSHPQTHVYASVCVCVCACVCDMV